MNGAMSFDALEPMVFRYNLTCLEALMQHPITITGDTAEVFIGRNYDKEAVMAAAYRLIDRHFVQIRENGLDCVVVFTQKEGQAMDAAATDRDLRSFLNDLLDEQLRLKLEERSGRIREIIVKHAFSPIDLKAELES